MTALPLDLPDDDEHWLIDEEQLAEILACWDRLVTGDMGAGARQPGGVVTQPLDVYLHGSDPNNDELPDDDLFAPYAADDPDVTPLGRLLYGVKEPTPASEEDQPDPP